MRSAAATTTATVKATREGGGGEVTVKRKSPCQDDDWFRSNGHTRQQACELARVDEPAAQARGGPEVRASLRRKAVGGVSGSSLRRRYASNSLLLSIP